MSRVAFRPGRFGSGRSAPAPRVLAALLLVSGCESPAFKNFTSGNFGPSTGESSSSSDTSGGSTGGEWSSSGSIETTTVGSGGMTMTSSTDGTAGSSSTDGSTGASSTTTGVASTGSSSGQAVCGDGAVDGTEECDDGNDDPEDGCASCFRDRWVFATSTLQSPESFGGLAGADSLCRQLAQKAGVGPNWTSYQAWLSDSHESAGERLFHGMGRYRRRDGVVIAENFEQFLSGALSATFDVDEFGQPAPGGAWTGTLPDGTAAPGTTHCADWTIDTYTEFEGVYGLPASIDGTWTFHHNPELNPTSCGAELRLYCFEGA